MLALDEQGVSWYFWFVLEFENVIVSFRAMHHNIIIAYSCVVKNLYNDDGTRLLIAFYFLANTKMVDVVLALDEQKVRWYCCIL